MSAWIYLQASHTGPAGWYLFDDAGVPAAFVPAAELVPPAAEVAAAMAAETEHLVEAGRFEGHPPFTGKLMSFTWEFGADPDVGWYRFDDEGEVIAFVAGAESPPPWDELRRASEPLIAAGYVSDGRPGHERAA